MKIKIDLFFAVLLISIVFVSGCTSTADNSKLAAYQKTASPNSWTGVCNLNDECKRLQAKCADAFENGDVAISYDAYKKSPTYGQASLTFFDSFKGKVCEDWMNWVIIASDQSNETTKGFIWQWAEDAGYANFERDVCVSEVCRPYLFSNYSVWSNCYSLCGKSENEAKSYIQSITPTWSIELGTYDYSDKKTYSSNYVSYTVNDNKIYAKSDKGLQYAEYLLFTYNKPLSSFATFEFDYSINSLNQSGIVAVSYFHIGRDDGGQNKDFEVGDLMPELRDKGEIPIGKYHIKYTFFQNNNTNTEITLPNGTVLAKTFENNKNREFTINIRIGNFGFEFIFENFKGE